MARYHVKADGSMGVCTAREGNCPFGDDEGTKHFASEAEARIYSERLIKDFSTNGSKSLKRSTSEPGAPVARKLPYIKSNNGNGSKSLKRSTSEPGAPVARKLPYIKSNNGVVLEYDPVVGGYVSITDGHVTKDQLIGDYHLDPHMVQDYFDSYDNDLDPDEVVDSYGGVVNVYNLSKLPVEFMNNDWYAGYDTAELKDSMDTLDRMYDHDYRPLKSDVGDLLCKDDFEDPDEAQDVIDRIDELKDSMDTLDRMYDHDYRPLKSDVGDLLCKDDFEDPDEAQDVIDRIDDQMVEVEGLIAELEEAGLHLMGLIPSTRGTPHSISVPWRL